MAGHSESVIAERRRQVAYLWLRGTPVSNIANAVKASASTVTRDVTAIRADLQRAHAAEIEDARNRSLAVFRLVQQDAWALFARLKDTSPNKVGSLNTIVSAEERIARIEGTLGADHVSTTTVNVLGAPAWQEARATLLAALRGYPEARIAAAEALLAIEAGQAPTPIRVVAADSEGVSDGNE
ncbi:MAG TPA: hypothetical protein VMV29_11815 [Ktedonobacterales bacterium]|nr:hypothetical protein [Ktedonobacterales bacterium]